MKPILLAAAVLPLSMASAQTAATTLARLAEQAAAVAKVRVLAVARTDRTQVVLRPLEVFSGAELPPTLVLTEPGGRACGRALHGLIPGSSGVAFFAAPRADGSWRLLGGGARALASLEPGLVDHVRRLCSRPSDRLAALVDGFDSASERVRSDAVHALPSLPELDRASPQHRQRIADELLRSVGESRRGAIELLMAAARLELRTAQPVLLDRYLAGPTPFDVALRRAIARIDPQAAGKELERRLAASPARTAHRALEVAAELPADAARNALTRIARAAARRDRVHAGTVWLRAGLDRSRLSLLLTAEDLAECERCADEAPRFRSIRRRPNR